MYLPPSPCVPLFHGTSRCTSQISLQNHYMEFYPNVWYEGEVRCQACDICSRRNAKIFFALHHDMVQEISACLDRCSGMKIPKGVMWIFSWILSGAGASSIRWG